MQKVLSEGVQCRAIASDPADGTPITIFKGLEESSHGHPPNVDENIADQLATSIKIKVEEHTPWIFQSID